MKKLLGLFIFLLCAVATASHTAPAPRCADLVVRSHPVSGGGARLKAAVPNYDPKQDMLFFFHGGAHASLFVGNYYWDHWGTGEAARITVHPNPQVILRGIAVRVRIGEARVRALEETISQGKTPIAHTTSCHLNQLAFLQRHGIFLKNGPRLLGTSTIREILESGFVDEQETQLPTQEIITVEGEDKTLSSMIPNGLHHYPLDNVVLFFGMFGLNSEEMLLEVEACTQWPQALELTTAIRNVQNQSLNASQQLLLNDFVERVETRALELTRCKYQAPLSNLLELLAYHPAVIPTDELRQILRQAIRDSL